MFTASFTTKGVNTLYSLEDWRGWPLKFIELDPSDILLQELCRRQPKVRLG
jgi:hypothetical protein